MYLTETQKKDYYLIRYLAEQVFSEPIIAISPLSNGWISDSYEINGHLIFKLPTKRTPIDNWIRVSQCAPAIQKHLSYKIPLPKLKPVFLNSTSQDFLLSSSYKKIYGNVISSEDFSKEDLSFKKRFFEQLSDALIELHSVDPTCLPQKLQTAEEFFQKFFGMQIAQASPTQQKWAQKIFSSCLSGLKNKPHDVLCHSDLRASNICLNCRSEFVGILDFDSLNQGNSFVEFHPRLYWHEKDTELFRQIYEKRSKKTIAEDNIKEMRKIYRGLYGLRAVVNGLQKTEKITHSLTHLFKGKDSR